MNAEYLVCFTAFMTGLCFPLSFFLPSKWKYIPIIGMVLSFVLLSSINEHYMERPVYYKFSHLTPDGWVHITGEGTDAYNVDVSKVTPGCHLIVYHGFDYHGLYFFPPKVLVMKPIKCGDRVANTSAVAYNDTVGLEY